MPKKKPEPKKPAAKPFGDSVLQSQLSDYLKLRADAGTSKRESEADIAEYYGRQDSPAVADKYKTTKAARLKKVAKSKAELKKERKPVRQAALRALKAKDKNITKKELARYKEAAKGHARKTVSRTKDVQETKTVARNAKKVAEERKAKKKEFAQARFAKLKSRGVKIDKARKTKVRTKAAARALRSVATTRRVGVFDTKRQLVQKGRPGISQDEGVYQKELRETKSKDEQSLRDQAAARGFIHSGVFNKKFADYGTEYGKQAAEIGRQKASKYKSTARSYQDAIEKIRLGEQQAHQEAARRKVQKATGA